jgi:hypothetical protein
VQMKTWSFYSRDSFSPKKRVFKFDHMILGFLGDISDPLRKYLSSESGSLYRGSTGCLLGEP